MRKTRRPKFHHTIRHTNLKNWNFEFCMGKLLCAHGKLFFEYFEGSRSCNRSDRGEHKLITWQWNIAEHHSYNCCSKNRSYKIQFSHSNFCAQPDWTWQLTFQDMRTKIAITLLFYLLFRGWVLAQIAQNCKTRLSRPFLGPREDHFWQSYDGNASKTDS